MEQAENIRYKVVVNHEEQYSIYPSFKLTPPGWREEGMEGTKQECLQHIERVWTDMRPLSVRQHAAHPAHEPRSTTNHSL